MLVATNYFIPDASLEQIQVLHVDDEPPLLDLAKTFLEREDDRFTVEIATSADEGLERINDRLPDCIVSDYNMPSLDGIGFLQAVRAKHPDLPFILYTGKGSEAVASDAIAADVTDYLQKGSGSEQYELLANRIRNAVKTRRETQRADRQEELMRLTEFAGDTGGFEVDMGTGEIILTDGAEQIIDPGEDAPLTIETGSEYIHPEDQEEIRRAIGRAAETGEQTRGTWRYQPPNGEQQLLEWTFTPTATNGDETTLRGAINDITDRRERQQELRRLRQAIDDASVSVTLADASQPDHPLVYVNDAFEETTGYTPEETLGRNCRFLQGEDTDPEKVAALREAIDNEEQITVELRNYRKDGTEFWNRLTVTPIHEDGEVVRYLGTQEDITEQKERQQELKEYATITESLADAMYVLDEEGQFTFVNEELVELVGYDRETILGNTPSLIKDGETIEQAEHQLGRLLSSDGPETVTFEVMIQPRRGDPIICEDHMGVLPFDGDKFDGSVGVLRDITEHKKYEQKLEAQNERLEEFTSIVSHDLRNPLSIVEGHLELAQETCESDHLTQVADALDRSQALIDDLLRLAREGDTVGELEAVGLADIAGSSWQTVETEPATFETHATRPLRADRSRLQGLLENLYRNAIEHGGDDVSVSVGAMDDGFYVADTGPGIPESERGEIFEAGYSTNEDGTGFGLRIVEQIVDAHGWEITVTESEQGGARFDITGVEFADR